MIRDDNAIRTAELTRELIQFAQIGEGAVSISREMLKEGFTLLSAKFGGLLANAEEELDPVFEAFEIELLKERFGKCGLATSSGWKLLGYQSEFLDDLLASAGFEREDLENLSRSAEIDRRIEAQSWAWRYRRSNLEHWRSSAQQKVVAEEKRRQYSAMPGGNKGNVTVEGLCQSIKRQFTEQGYAERKVKGKANFFKFFQATGPISLEFSFEIETVPITIFPVICCLRVTIPISTNDSMSSKINLARDSLAKQLEALIPNFGVYRVAWNVEELAVLRRAYEGLILRLVPLIESNCEIRG